jgi:uncharacterized protein with HEPN domain
MKKPPKDPNVYLLDILLQIQKILTYTQAGDRDGKTYDAVQYCLMVIGEAARRVPDSIKASYPSVPWREINGLRNLLIHEYEDIIESVVWKIVEVHLPQLKPEIEQLIQTLEGN